MKIRRERERERFQQFWKAERAERTFLSNVLTAHTNAIPHSTLLPRPRTSRLFPLTGSGAILISHIYLFIYIYIDVCFLCHILRARARARARAYKKDVSIYISRETLENHPSFPEPFRCPFLGHLRARARACDLPN